MDNFSKFIKAIPQTEKTVKDWAKNKYHFIVSPELNKIDFTRHIKSLYWVDVKSVNVINIKPKFRNVWKRVIYKRKPCTKMIITLKDWQNFNFTSLKKPK